MGIHFLRKPEMQQLSFAAEFVLSIAEISATAERLDQELDIENMVRMFRQELSKARDAEFLIDDPAQAKRNTYAQRRLENGLKLAEAALVFINTKRQIDATWPAPKSEGPAKP